MSWMLRSLALVLAITTAGCEALVDVFQAGLVVGIVAVLLIVGGLAWVLRKLRGRRPTN